MKKLGEGLSLKAKAVICVGAFVAFVVCAVLAKSALTAQPPDEAPSAADAPAASQGTAEAAPETRYEGDAAEVAQILASSAWQDAHGRIYRFTDSEVSGPDGSAHAYGIGAVDMAEAEPSAAKVTQYTFAVTVDGEQGIARLAAKKTDAKKAATWTLVCKQLASDPLSQAAVGQCEVKGIDEPTERLLGGADAKDAVEAAVRDYMKENHPAAEVATFAGAAKYDAETGTVDMGFYVSDAAKSTLAVAYGLDTGEVEVR